MTVDNSSVVLGYIDLVGRAQHFESSLLELESLLLADDYTTGKYGDILEHGLATVAKARSLDSAYLQATTQTVDNQSGESLRVYILGDNQQWTAALSSRLQDRQEVLEVGYLLVVDEDIWILHNTLHLVGICHEIR